MHFESTISSKINCKFFDWLHLFCCLE